MRGHISPQSHMFSYFSPEERVPAKHPLRSIKAYTDAALAQIRPLLDGIYSEIGRPSIPPAPITLCNWCDRGQPCGVVFFDVSGRRRQGQDPGVERPKQGNANDRCDEYFRYLPAWCLGLFRGRRHHVEP